jgi:hypothetical protein
MVTAQLFKTRILKRINLVGAYHPYLAKKTKHTKIPITNKERSKHLAIFTRNHL